MTVSGDGNSGGPGDDPLSTYETELTALHDSIGQVVQVLLTDSVNVVKQTLMEHSVTRLAPFFGRTKGELAANKHFKQINSSTVSTFSIADTSPFKKENLMFNKKRTTFCLRPVSEADAEGLGTTISPPPHPPTFLLNFYFKWFPVTHKMTNAMILFDNF
jgi:hypothetical protein